MVAVASIAIGVIVGAVLFFSLLGGRPSIGFVDFETQLVADDRLRREAAESLADLLETGSEENLAAADAFTSSYDAVARPWDAFHADYDSWRSIEGGCSRSDAAGTLGVFVNRFGDLVKDVRSLPRATVLRPLGELMIEAAEREERALLSVRNGWRPFDTTVYAAFDEGRSAANKLRRQVVAGLNDLFFLYDITPADLTP